METADGNTLAIIFLVGCFVGVVAAIIFGFLFSAVTVAAIVMTVYMCASPSQLPQCGTGSSGSATPCEIPRTTS